MANPSVLLKKNLPNSYQSLMPQQTFGSGHSVATAMKSGLTFIADKMTIFTDVVYGTEGRRYLFEQTFGFTVPRMLQQLYRNEDITGTLNTVAAGEMFARDLSADIADTMMPGLLARFVIGAAIDATKGTLTKRMMGSDALRFYRHTVNESKDYRGFIEDIEKQMKAHAVSVSESGAKITEPLQLEKRLNTLLDRPNKKGLNNKKGLKKAVAKTAKELADVLKLSDLDISFKHPLSTEQTKTVTMTLEELVGDLRAIREKYITKLQPKGKLWKKALPNLLERTRKFSQWHMVANVIALATSLAIPLLIRMATKAVYGVDAFPGTKAIRDHFRKAKKVAADKAPPPEETSSKALTEAKPQDETKDKLVWFPYLKKCWNEKNWKPLAITAGFFTAMLGAVYFNRFTYQVAGKRIAKKLSWKNMVKAYEFERSFPWTTVPQMELTYGLLCGTRLLTARDRNEFNETGLRDALLGWPTLTYGFPLLQKGLFKLGNKVMKGQFFKKAAKPIELLIKGGRSGGAKSVRTAAEVKPSLLVRALPRSVQNKYTPDVLEKMVRRVVSGLTLTAGATSIGLLSWLEPKWGINWTNKLELSHRREQLKELAGSIYDNTRSRLQLGSDYVVSHITPRQKPTFEPTQSAYYQQAKWALQNDNHPYIQANTPLKVASRTAIKQRA